MHESSRTSQTHANRVVLGMTTKRILVVDDEATIREVIAVCLRRLGGWEILTAASGREALQTAHTEAPDVIVLDIMMAEMDGVTFLQRLRSNPITQIIPVILLTSSHYLPAPDVLTQLGVIQVIAKPFDSVALVQQIAQAMGW